MRFIHLSLASTLAMSLSEAAPAALNSVFEKYDAAQLAASPQAKSYRGIRDQDYSKWDDPSEAAAQRDYDLMQSTLKQMRADYSLDDLSEQDALSFRLFEAMAGRSASLWPHRKYGYIFDQMRGAQSRIPAFLINIHRISDARADNGVMPPDWAYPYVISDIENLLGAGEDNAILADFDSKLMMMACGASLKAKLITKPCLPITPRPI